MSLRILVISIAAFFSAFIFLKNNSGENSDFLLQIKPSGASGVLFRNEEGAIKISVVNQSQQEAEFNLSVRCVFDLNNDSVVNNYPVHLNGKDSLEKVIKLSTDQIGYWQINSALTTTNGNVVQNVTSGIAIVEKPADYGREDTSSFFGIMKIEDFEAADRMGCKFDRMPAIWCYIEKENGVYDWTELDKKIALAEAHGIGVVLSIWPDYKKGNATLKWAPWHSDLEMVQEPNIKYLQRFLSAIVERYKDRVTAFELTNEPDLAFYKTPNNTRAEGALITKKIFEEGYNIIKKIAPSKPVIGMSVSGGEFRNGLPFVQDVFQSQEKFFDILGAHPYAPGRFIDSEHAPQYPDEYNLRGVVQSGIEKMKSLGLPARFWGTEIGWAYYDGAEPLSTAGRELAAVTSQALVTLKSVPGAERIFWFVFSYPGNYGPGSKYNFSLIYSKGVPSFPYPSVNAYAAVSRLLYHTVPSQTITVGGAVHLSVFDKNGDQNVVVLWSNKRKYMLDNSITLQYTTFDMFGRKIEGNEQQTKPGISNEPLFFVINKNDFAAFKIQLVKALRS